MPPAVPVLAIRRLTAFLIDYAVIAVYLGLLTALGGVSRVVRHRSLAFPRTAGEKIVGHALSFVVLTLPVMLYFAVSEASATQGTLGKRVMHLSVTAIDGGRVSFGRSLLRAAVKFIPWEIAHTAIWHVPGQPFVAQPPMVNSAGYILALGGATGYAASLFVGDGRTPYDHLAGTTVIAVGAGRTGLWGTAHRPGAASHRQWRHA